MIGENEDLDDSKFWIVGNYYCSLNVVVATLKNCPIADAFTMKVMCGNGNAYPTQIIRDFLYGKIYYRVKTDTPQPWKRLVDESMMQWKSKSLRKTFSAVHTNLVIDIPEIAGANECIFTVGIASARYTFCHWTNTGLYQSSGFQFFSPVNAGQSFTGYFYRSGETQLTARLVSVIDFDVHSIEVIDVVYR